MITTKHFDTAIALLIDRCNIANENLAHEYKEHEVDAIYERMGELQESIAYVSFIKEYHLGLLTFIELPSDIEHIHDVTVSCITDKDFYFEQDELMNDMALVVEALEQEIYAFI